MGEIDNIIRILETELSVAKKQFEQYVVSKEQAMKFISQGYVSGIEYSLDQAKKLRDIPKENLCKII